MLFRLSIPFRPPSQFHAVAFVSPVCQCLLSRCVCRAAAVYPSVLSTSCCVCVCAVSLLFPRPWLCCSCWVA